MCEAVGAPADSCNHCPRGAPQLTLDALGGNHSSRHGEFRNDHLPHVRCGISRGDPDRFLPLLLRMSFVQNPASAEAGRLLRVLFIWRLGSETGNLTAIVRGMAAGTTLVTSEMAINQDSP